MLGCYVVASCAGSSPAAPSATRIAGAWIAHATLTSVTGGECVGAALQASLGSRDVFSARIERNASALAASLTYQGNGTSCVFRGSVSDASLDLTLSSCPAGRVPSFVCTGGATRDLEIASAHVTAHNSADTGSGSDVTTWNVFAPGTTTPLATLTATAQFTWNALGIPHDDFHIFDGSVLPGYVDGIVIIPEEPNPFCSTCGWFERRTFGSFGTFGRSDRSGWDRSNVPNVNGSNDPNVSNPPND